MWKDIKKNISFGKRRKAHQIKENFTKQKEK